MTWAVPNWWSFSLLALAAWRIFHLLAEDVILDRPRAWIVKHTGEKFDEWLLCPFCCGAWLSVAWWLAWVWQAHWTLVAATPCALSAVVALVAVRAEE